MSTSPRRSEAERRALLASYDAGDAAARAGLLAAEGLTPAQLARWRRDLRSAPVPAAATRAAPRPAPRPAPRARPTTARRAGKPPAAADAPSRPLRAPADPAELSEHAWGVLQHGEQLLAALDARGIGGADRDRLQEWLELLAALMHRLDKRLHPADEPTTDAAQRLAAAAAAAAKVRDAQRRRPVRTAGGAISGAARRPPWWGRA